MEVSSLIGTKYQTFGYKLLSALPSQIRNPAIKGIVNYRKKKAFSLKSPKTLTLYVTNYCNLKCVHCFYTNELNTGKPEFSLPELQRIITTMDPLDTVMLTGGEPFIRQDILQICNTFYVLNDTRRITIPTNGFYTKKTLEIVPQLLEMNPKKVLHIQVSIDATEQVHDQFRGLKNSFKYAINTLNGLVSLQEKYNNLDVSVATTIAANNYDSVIGLAEFITKEFPTVLHKFNVLRGSHLGTYDVPKEIQSDLDGDIDSVTAKSPEELETIFNKIEKIIAKNNDPILQNFQRNKWKVSVEMLKEKKKIWDCTAGYTYGVIYPDGGVAVCEATKPFANLYNFDLDFRKLWLSHPANKMRQMTRECYCIHPCNTVDSTQYDSQQVIQIMNMKKI